MLGIASASIAGSVHAIAHQDVPAGIRLLAHARMAAGEHLGALAEIGGDDRHAQGTRGTECHGSRVAARIVAHASLARNRSSAARHGVASCGDRGRCGFDLGERRQALREREARATGREGKWLGR